MPEILYNHVPTPEEIRACESTEQLAVWGWELLAGHDRDSIAFLPEGAVNVESAAFMQLCDLPAGWDLMIDCFGGECEADLFIKKRSGHADAGADYTVKVPITLSTARDGSGRLIQGTYAAVCRALVKARLIAHLIHEREGK